MKSSDSLFFSDKKVISQLGCHQPSPRLSVGQKALLCICKDLLGRGTCVCISRLHTESIPVMQSCIHVLLCPLQLKRAQNLRACGVDAHCNCKRIQAKYVRTELARVLRRRKKKVQSYHEFHDGKSRREGLSEGA
jgi:hypothetical protein